MKPYAFGVDIGGTTIKMGFFGTDGKFLDKWEITTRTENNGEKVLPDIARSIKKKLKENELTLDDLEGVGIGVPGPVLSDGRHRRSRACPFRRHCQSVRQPRMGSH